MVSVEEEAPAILTHLQENKCAFGNHGERFKSDKKKIVNKNESAELT